MTNYEIAAIVLPAISLVVAILSTILSNCACKKVKNLEVQIKNLSIVDKSKSMKAKDNARQAGRDYHE